MRLRQRSFNAMHRFCNSHTEAFRGLNLRQSIGAEYRFDHLPESESPKAGERIIEMHIAQWQHANVEFDYI